MRISPSNVVSIFLAVIMLSSIFFVVTSSSIGEYNPWLDTNDDGRIDMRDIGDLARSFGTVGTPITKAAIEYDSGWMDITDICGQYFGIEHALNSLDVMVDIVGKTTPDGGVHQRYLGGTGRIQGWSQTYGIAPEGFGEAAKSVVETSDGGYALAGNTYSIGSGFQFYLVKTNSLGVMQWNQTYGGAGNDGAESVVQTSDGGYALAGRLYTSGMDYQAYLVKTNSLGVMQWNQTYGGASDDYASSVVQTSDGGFALAGATSSFGLGYQAYLVKVNANGVMQWSQTYGGANLETAESVIQTSDGGYALAGYTSSYGSGAQAYLLKTDSGGTVQWMKFYGSSAGEFAESVIQTSDGGYALACNSDSFGAGGADFWLVKTDADGEFQWGITYGGVNDDFAESVVQTDDGGYALAGYTESFGAGMNDAWLVKTNENGVMQWSQTYGGAYNDYAESVVQTSDGGLALAGQTSSYDSVYLVKADIELGLCWCSTTINSITLYRGATDPYWNYVRIRVWKIKM